MSSRAVVTFHLEADTWEEIERAFQAAWVAAASHADTAAVMNKGWKK